MKDSYAQLGEDLVVDHYLSEQEKGVYLDIGAYDPIFLSNTYKFYKRGWRGITVEPNPEKAPLFRDTRPDDTHYAEACGVGELKFTLGSHDAISYCSPDGKTLVKTRTLAQYLGLLPQVDLLSIDTEGMEMTILDSNDWNVFRPKVIIVEVIDYETKKKHTEVIDYLVSKDYRLVCDNSINAIFLDKKLYNPIFKITE